MLAERASPAEHSAAAFHIRGALNGNSSCISLESAAYPGQFLRVKDRGVILAVNESSSDFKYAASWRRHNGLADPAAATFESFQCPGMFLRHKSFVAAIDYKELSDVFKKDASFFVEPAAPVVPAGMMPGMMPMPGVAPGMPGMMPMPATGGAMAMPYPYAYGGAGGGYMPVPMAMPAPAAAPAIPSTPAPALAAPGNSVCFVSHNYPKMRVLVKDGGAAVLEECRDPVNAKQTRFRIVPALNCLPGYVSFEMADGPNKGHLLRHQEFVLKLSKNDGTPVFAADASFKAVGGLADPAKASFVASNFPDRWIRHSGFKLCIAPSDSTALFAADATFAVEVPPTPAPAPDRSHRMPPGYAMGMDPRMAGMGMGHGMGMGPGMGMGMGPGAMGMGMPPMGMGMGMGMGSMMGRMMGMSMAMSAQAAGMADGVAAGMMAGMPPGSAPGSMPGGGMPPMGPR